MGTLFDELAKEVALAANFVGEDEANHVTGYLTETCKVSN
jgi:hypothetical protein